MLLALIIINYGIVLVFGVLTTISFAGIQYTPKNKRIIFCFILLLTAIQVSVYFAVGLYTAAKLYPFIIHLPVAMLIVLYFKKSWLTAAVSVFAAYLCCQTRRWIGSFALYIFDSKILFHIIQTIVTFPLLFLLIRYIAPPVNKLMSNSKRSLLLFGIVPFFYYIFDYATTVYTKLLYSGTRAAVEFMPSVMSMCYFVFVMIYFNEMQRKTEIENSQKILAIQVNQSLKELTSLRRSQEQAAIYRHDLRHHLQYVGGCITAGRYEEASKYIKETCDEVENSKIVRYCQNETVNLILSSYAAKAELAGAVFTVDTNVTEDELTASATDLCVILSNGLENALHACESVTKEKYISVTTRRQNGNTFWQIQNPYTKEPCFENGLPIANESGHGTGIKSIVMTVEKLGGLCDFIAEKGVFTMRVVL